MQVQLSSTAWRSVSGVQVLGGPPVGSTSSFCPSQGRPRLPSMSSVRSRPVLPAGASDQGGLSPTGEAPARCGRVAVLSTQPWLLQVSHRVGGEDCPEQ